MVFMPTDRFEWGTFLKSSTAVSLSAIMYSWMYQIRLIFAKDTESRMCQYLTIKNNCDCVDLIWNFLSWSELKIVYWPVGVTIDDSA